jgi:beta-galactosidase
MDRRDFIKSGGALVAALALQPKQVIGMASDANNRSVGRLILPMNQNWRFSPLRVENATQRDFNDAHFETVTVPHTNKKLPWHSFDEKSYEFVSTYRRKFRLPSRARGQRVFVDFAGAMTASTVWINGQRLGEYRGGYTPFSFELTPYVEWSRKNVLVVELDSSDRADIPPFGGKIDYLTFGGIYRDVSLRLVSPTYLENIFAQVKDVMTDHPSVDVSCFVEYPKSAPGQLTSSGFFDLEVELRDGDRVMATALQKIEPNLTTNPAVCKVSLANLGSIERWDLTNPRLYTVVVRLKQANATIDEDSRRIGFREARFTDDGFELNGRIVKLRGLNRHQTFPWVGAAMSARVQRRDAQILKQELKINIVRTSHYPQSPHFLDACDEFGLLVLEEIPGWQHIGDKQWQDLAVDNVRRMVRRDWNHPAIVLWGVRINESDDDHDFYTRTNAVAHELDPSRQTGGIQYIQESEFLEDVFTMNDFGFPLQKPNHPRYLNTEFVGHTYVTKSYDNGERLAEHIRRHARVHNQLGSGTQYAGGIGWCAFDYNTHDRFGSGDRVCYHGVSDIFRLPKPAAAFYQSQCDTTDEIVLEPAFEWASRGDLTNSFRKAIVCSNCDHLKFYVGATLAAEADPDRATFGNLPHPPFQLDLDSFPTGDLRIEGYVGEKKVIEKTFSHHGVDRDFVVTPDDTVLKADGADATRVSFRVVDEFGRLRRYTTGAIQFTLDGPAEIIGDNPFSLVGGSGAIWVRAKEKAGKAVLKVTHNLFGSREIEFRIEAGEAEII